MAWSTEMVIMIRHLINDLGTVPIYTDSRLQELILIAGQITQQQCTFQSVYSFNINNLTLTPDPSLSTILNSRDEAFMWLTTMKCCAIISKSEAKTSSGNAFIVKDSNLVQVDASKVASEKRAIADQWEEDYENARWLFQMSNRPSAAAVFGPFSLITPGLYGQAGGFNIMTPRDRPLFR